MSAIKTELIKVKIMQLVIGFWRFFLTRTAFGDDAVVAQQEHVFEVHTAPGNS